MQREFVIRQSRFVDGEYIKASPEDPKIILLPESQADCYFRKDAKGKLVFDPTIDPSLELYDGKGAAPSKLKQHYADVQKGEDIKLGPGAPMPVPTKANQSGRASDTEAF